MYRVGRWFPLSVLLTYGCTSPDGKPVDDIVTRTETVEVKVPVAVPCSERVKRTLDRLLNPDTAVTPTTESKVEAVTRSDSDHREYVARLEAAARRCGVTIE